MVKACHVAPLSVVSFGVAPADSWNHREPVANTTWASGSGTSATNLQLGASDANTLAKSGPAKQALTDLENAGIGEGSILPHEVLVDTAQTNPAKVAADLNQVKGIHGAVAPSTPDWHRSGTAIVEAIPIPDSGTPEGHDTLNSVRDTAHEARSSVTRGRRTSRGA